MKYSVAECARMSDETLLKEWQTLYGNTLLCKHCGKRPQPVRKFVNQIRNWCTVKYNGLTDALPSVPKTCDAQTTKNTLRRKVEGKLNNDYYRKKKEIQEIDLSDNERQTLLNLHYKEWQLNLSIVRAPSHTKEIMNDDDTSYMFE